MFKAKQKLMSLVLACVMMIACVFGAIATLVMPQTTAVAADKKTFVKVTSAPSDWSGDYLIVYEAGNVAFDGSLTKLDAVGNTISVTISNGEIAATDNTNAAKFTIAKSGTSYTIKSASGYYIGQTSNANGLKSSTSTTYSHTISINTDGSVNLVSGGAYLRYNFAIDQVRFRYYKSSSYTGQKAIQLYKLEEVSSGDSSEPENSETPEPTCEHTNKSTTTVDATCTTAGSTTVTCDDCGVTVSTEAIPATGHSYGEPQETVAPTCTTAGEKSYTCETCQEPKTETIPANGHTYEGDNCSVCGEPKPAILTLDFSTTDNRTSITSSQQVWEQNGIKLTNDKDSSTSNIADYSNPARFYKSSKITIEYPSMIGIIFHCNDETYAKALGETIGGDTAIISGKQVTLTFSEPTDSWTIKLTVSKIFMDYLEVEYEKAPTTQESSTQDLLNEVQAYMQLSYKYTENDGTLSNSNFWIKCAVDDSLANVADVYGIMVTANDKTPVKYTGKEVLTTEDGKIYVVIALRDIINDLGKLNTEFTVQAYVEIDGKEIVSDSFKTHSVASMVTTYYDGTWSTEATAEQKAEVKAKVAHLYTYLNKEEA